MGNDPVMARLAHVKRVWEGNFAVQSATGTYGYNPVPGNPDGVKPVTAAVYEALRVMYWLFLTLDLEAFNAAREAAGHKPMGRVAAVIEEAPDHLPGMLDVLGPNGYPVEITPGVYRFAVMFFAKSLEATANKAQPDRRPARSNPITLRKKPAKPSVARNKQVPATAAS